METNKIVKSEKVKRGLIIGGSVIAAGSIIYTGIDLGKKAYKFLKEKIANRRASANDIEEDVEIDDEMLQ